MLFLWLACFIVFVCLSRTVGAVLSYLKPLFFVFIVIWLIDIVYTIVADMVMAITMNEFVFAVICVCIILFIMGCLQRRRPNYTGDNIYFLSPKRRKL